MRNLSQRLALLLLQGTPLVLLSHRNFVVVAFSPPLTMQGHGSTKGVSLAAVADSDSSASGQATTESTLDLSSSYFMDQLPPSAPKKQTSSNKEEKADTRLPPLSYFADRDQFIKDSFDAVDPADVVVASTHEMAAPPEAHNDDQEETLSLLSAVNAKDTQETKESPLPSSSSFVDQLDQLRDELTTVNEQAKGDIPLFPAGPTDAIPEQVAEEPIGEVQGKDATELTSEIAATTLEEDAATELAASVELLTPHPPEALPSLELVKRILLASSPVVKLKPKRRSNKADLPSLKAMRRNLAKPRNPIQSATGTANVWGDVVAGLWNGMSSSSKQQESTTASQKRTARTPASKPTLSNVAGFWNDITTWPENSASVKKTPPPQLKNKPGYTISRITAAAKKQAQRTASQQRAPPPQGYRTTSMEWGVTQPTADTMNNLFSSLRKHKKE